MSTTPLLQVQGLVKRFGALAATDRAELAIAPGELHGLIGPNGAGKTTLIHQLSGALAPDAGRITLAGEDVTRLPMHRRAQRGLVRSYQITSLFGRLPVLDNLVLALTARARAHTRLWRPAWRDTARRDEAAALAAQVGLGAQLARPAGTLSHGGQRQLELGLALALKPRLLLLDEPMAGMGPAEGEALVALLQGLRGQLTMLLVEHDMAAVFSLADRISTLVAGRVVATGTPAEIRAHPAVREAYLGDEWGTET